MWSPRESEGVPGHVRKMACHGFLEAEKSFPEEGIAPSRWAEVSEGMWRLDDLFFKRYKSMYCRCTAEATSREPQSGDMREFDWYDLDKVTRVTRWRKDCRGS